MPVALIDGDVLLHWALWGTKSLNDFKKNVEETLPDWVEAPFCEDYILALGSPDGKNYRDDVFPDYKQSSTRAAGRKKRVAHSKASRGWLNQRDDSFVADNIEADDLLGIWATDLGGEGVIVTVDKDLDQIPGPHYNPRRNQLYHVSEQEAADFFLLQMLTGDPMDNIPGVMQLGPVKSKAILETAEDKPKEVISQYQRVYGDDWQSHFLTNGKLLFIQRRADQHFTFKTYEELYS